MLDRQISDAVCMLNNKKYFGSILEDPTVAVALHDIAALRVMEF